MWVVRKSYRAENEIGIVCAVEWDWLGSGKGVVFCKADEAAQVARDADPLVEGRI
jgi:hypothetical protein